MPSTVPIPQAAAIPVHDGLICLVTATSGKHWTVPKGIIDPGKTAGETALQESWEEAGVIGRLGPQPIGSYIYDKSFGTCQVTVFLLHVSEIADEWPEYALRRRRWFTPEDALGRLRNPELQRIVRDALSGIEGVSP